MKMQATACRPLTIVTYPGSRHTRSTITFLRFLLLSLQLKQEAQLLQRGHTILHVVAYFARSLEVIRNDTIK